MADLHALSQTLSDTLRLPDMTVHWLQPALLPLIALGEPVTVAEIAAACGRPVPEIQAALREMPDTELDDAGRVVGWGITQRPTPHQFEVDGRYLFTWCALDTLMFPALLGQAASVTSPCHATGEPVHVQVDVNPDRVSTVTPAEAVVSIVTPGKTASIRGAFCNQVHFFASADAAAPWLAEHPGASVLPVAEAFELGRPLVAQMAAGSSDCY
jgi:alkylmercury lyase